MSENLENVAAFASCGTADPAPACGSTDPRRPLLAVLPAALPTRLSLPPAAPLIPRPLLPAALPTQRLLRSVAPLAALLTLSK